MRSKRGKLGAVKNSQKKLGAVRKQILSGAAMSYPEQERLLWISEEQLRAGGSSKAQSGAVRSWREQ